jgi:hypothetical protein
VIAWFRYARRAEVPALLASGQWAVIADLGPTHGFYAVLLQWCGEGEPGGMSQNHLGPSAPGHKSPGPGPSVT